MPKPYFCHVAPAAGERTVAHAADAFAPPDDAKAVFLLQRDTGLVF